MKWITKDLRKAAASLQNAEKITQSKFVRGKITQEPAYTDYLLANIERQLKSRTIGPVYWEATVYGDRARGSSESQFGADFAGVLTIRSGSFSLSKGFLAQAKLLWKSPAVVKARGNVSGSPVMQRVDYQDLHDQCVKMQRITPASFVFFYTPEGTRIVPAISITGGKRRFPARNDDRNYCWWSLYRFFLAHFESFIGDGRIQAADEAELKALMREYDIARAIHLSAFVKDDDENFPKPIWPKPVEPRENSR